MTDVFEADDLGNPVLKGRSHLHASGEVFAGWWQIGRSAKPFSVALRHELGIPLYTSHFWVWVSGSAPESYPLAGRKSHPLEAGPVLIQQTPTTVYCHFEADKPIFARFIENSGSFELIDIGWLGVLVRPVS